MRLSEPIPLRTILTSAPTNSQRLAMSFIKLIRVASIELAAYFVISAEGISMKITRKLFSKNGRYNLVISSLAFSDSTPTTTRSGVIKSFIALPSFRNSGLLATSKSISTPRFCSSAASVARTFLAVPTGTVLLVTTSTYLFIFCPIVRATSSTYERSALPSSLGGVPTAQNTIDTSSRHPLSEVVKCNRPAFTLRSTISSSPGS